MSAKNLLESGKVLSLDFSKLSKIFGVSSEEGKCDVIPVVVQDYESKEVLLIAYANKESLEYSLINKVGAFWSTTRNELWVKGSSSACILELCEVRVNCEQNSLLYLVKPLNGLGACHVLDENGEYFKSCFYRQILSTRKTLRFMPKKSRRRKMKMILAIPNGSLYEPTIAILKKLGIKVITSGRKFEARIVGSEIFDRAIIMRPQDMPEALIDGMIDVAIYGRDWHEEIGLGDKLAVIAELNYSKKTNAPVRVVIFSKHNKLVDEVGILVTTEYPHLAALFFKKATIRFSHGGTEQKVAFGKYDYGICVTETGDSLRENGLIIVKEILISPTLLVAREKNQELEYFADLLKGALRSDGLRLLKMNVGKLSLPAVLSALPALESPTVSQQSNGEFAVETIVSSDTVADLIIKLRSKGASGIFSQTIEIVC